MDQVDFILDCFTLPEDSKLFSSFKEINRSSYTLEIKATSEMVSINVPENVTSDVAGNKNLASNVLQVRHCKDLFCHSLISGIGLFLSLTFVL